MPQTHPLTSLVDRAAPITGEELHHLPDLGPCELVEGRIRPMSPTGRPHSRIVMQLGRLLSDFVQAQNLGEVHGGEVGIYTQRNPDTVRGADVAVISHERLSDASEEGFLDAAPELVVEVLSPSNRDADLDAKIEEYFGIGVEQLWIVNPKEEVLHRYRAPNRVDRLTKENVLHGEGLLEGVQLPLAELFDLD